MRRTEPKSIAQIVGDLLRSQNLEEGMMMHRALSVWPEVVGPVINRQTVERRVDKGVMYVRINSAAVRNELSMQRTVLIDALNKRLGQSVIKEIRFI